MTTLKNSVRLIGFLGKNPEVKTISENKTLARVSIATHDSFKNKEGEWETETQWHNLVMWGSQALYAEKNLEKGSEIVIEGKLVNSTYTDSAGITRYFTEVKVNQIHLFKSKEVAAS